MKNQRLDQTKNVLLIGGRGFVGKYLHKSLIQNGYKVFIGSRSSKNIENIVELDISDRESIRKALQNIDFVVNLAGLSPIKNYSYDKYYSTHVKGVENIIQATNKMKIERFIHISALGVRHNQSSDYNKTKYLAENLIIKSKINHSIIAPSIIYGQGGELFKIFNLLKYIKLLPLPKIQAKVQPIYVDDLVEIIVTELKNHQKSKYLQVVGKDIMTFYEFMKIYFRSKFCLILPINSKLVSIMLKIFVKTGILPKGIISQLVDDNIVSDKYYHVYGNTRFADWCKSNK
jgi:uncharacterized protein YbjT (DUF2867 family)